MATAKPRRSRKTTTTRRANVAKPASTTLLSRTGRTMRDRPYASAAIATGAAALTAGLAGLFFMKKSGKSFSDVADGISSKSKSVATEAKAKFDDVSAKVKDGFTDARAKASESLQRRRDGIDPDKPQSEIMEEALTLKATGKKTKKPVDPVIEQQTKVGAIAY